MIDPDARSVVTHVLCSEGDFRVLGGWEPAWWCIPGLLSKHEIGRMCRPSDHGFRVLGDWRMQRIRSRRAGTWVLDAAVDT